jgi:hypothetical protein
LEDLVYEALDQIETEVLSFTTHVRMVEKEEWHGDDAEMLNEDTALVVEKSLTLSDSVTPELLGQRLQEIHLFGTIYTVSSSQKALVQRLLQTNHGEVIDLSKQELKEGLDNIGELTL